MVIALPGRKGMEAAVLRVAAISQEGYILSN